jgi:mannose-1-phosphate guanylyltransferase
VKAVILVGGEGTRLRPLTLSTPKAMVPIANRPFLAHMIDYLKVHGIDDVILAMGYLPDPIQAHFGDGSSSNTRLSYIIEDSPLGTAGAVKNAAGYIDDTFFVFNGDTFTDIDLTKMLELHRNKHAKVTIALTPVEDPTVYGVVETDNGGRVQRFVEKPSRDAVTTNMVNAGAYVLEPEVLNLIPKGEHFMFEHGVFPEILNRGDAIYGYESDDYWIDIGTPQKYLKVNHDLLSGKAMGGFAGELIGERIWVEQGSEIHPQAKIEGPVAIGKDCVLSSGSRVKGPAVIGPDCIMGVDSSIERAVIWNGIRIGAGVSLKECIIAENVTIGDGSQIMEGCVLGHDVMVQDGERLDPGTEVWPSSAET